jgi:hypothetical protein
MSEQQQLGLGLPRYRGDQRPWPHVSDYYAWRDRERESTLRGSDPSSGLISSASCTPESNRGNAARI